MFFKTRTFVVILVKIAIKIDPTLGVVHCCVCPVFLAAIFSLRSCCFACCPCWFCSLVFHVVPSVLTIYCVKKVG
jgi:hypothetical protein